MRRRKLSQIRPKISIGVSSRQPIFIGQKMTLLLKKREIRRRMAKRLQDSRRKLVGMTIKMNCRIQMPLEHLKKSVLRKR
jgi:transposase